MNLILVFASALMMIAFPGHTPAYPGVSSLLLGQIPEGLECQPGSSSINGEKIGNGSTTSGDALDSPRPSRVAGFALSGEFRCQRPVFSENERNPFIERLVGAQLALAKRVAVSLRETTHDLSPNVPIAIVASGLNDADLERKVASLYRAQLAETLGPGRVRESVAGATAENESGPVLWVELQYSDIPERMAHLHWRTGNEVNEAGQPSWRDL